MAIKENYWGLEASVDLYGCDAELIRNAEKIRRFVEILCDDVIKMKRFGDCQITHFGEDERVAGFTMVQLIETSNVTAHFANATNAVYLNVFSCKGFDPIAVEKYAKKFFHAKDSQLIVNYRK